MVNRQKFWRCPRIKRKNKVWVWGICLSYAYSILICFPFCPKSLCLYSLKIEQQNFKLRNFRIAITTVKTLFSAIFSCCLPNFFPRGWGGYSHFWGPKAPKSGVRAPKARGLRKFLWFLKEFVVWNYAPKGILTKNFDDRRGGGDSTSELRFKSIKMSDFCIPPSPPWHFSNFLDDRAGGGRRPLNGVLKE